MKLQSIFTNSFGILFSRITGFIRDLLMASILGASIYSDMFFVAFKLPNLFRRIFAEGAFTQAFMPSFVASRHKGVFANAIFLRFLLFITLGTLVVNLFPEVATKMLAFGWSADIISKAAPLTAINFWYLELIFIVTFLATLLQYKEHFATTALATALLNISMIVALLMTMHKEPKSVAYAISFAVIVGGLLQVVVHIIAICKKDLHRVLLGGWKYRKSRDVTSKERAFTKLFIPAIWGNSTAQINSFIDTLLASFLLSGSISYLFYANRVFQLPLAIFAIATATALFPSVSKAIKNKESQKAYENLNRAFWFLTYALGLAMVGGIMLAEPIVWLLFERGNFTLESTHATTGVLMMYMVGLFPFGLAKLFSLFLYASHRQKTAAKIATYSLVVNITASLLLMDPLGAKGLALAGSLGGWVLFIFTVKEVGSDRFFMMIKSLNTLYFLLVMSGFALFLHWLNTLLLSYIR